MTTPSKLSVTFTGTDNRTLVDDLKCVDVLQRVRDELRFDTGREM